MAIGLCISIPKTGSAFNSLISPKVATSNENGVAEAFLIGAVWIVFSYACGLILIYMDKESDKREKKQADLF